MRVEFTHDCPCFICLFGKKIILPAILEVVAMAAITKSKLIQRI